MKLGFTYIPGDRQIVSLSSGQMFQQERATAYRDTDRKITEDIISQIKDGIPWRDAVRNCFEQSNKWLYSIVTHPNRDLFFRLHPLPAGAYVLDVGSGWGQIALPLAASGCSVCVLEPTPERLNFIRAAGEQESLTKKMFFVGCDYQDVEFHERFDVITCIGVLEWCGNFRNGQDAQSTQRAFLKKFRSDLKADGYCVIGIENRFGLKYWLGAAGDHLGVPDIEILDAHLAKKRWRQKSGLELRTFTYTMAEYREMLTDAGFREISFFAAFPDYKLPQVIISTEKTEQLAEFLRQSNAQEYRTVIA
jgi:2-polyprenyl-3-methyl-5-hydroxy-6-metoxy-1,4-benzoquinol methylase